MLKRSALAPHEVDPLCNELNRIAAERNVIAHNPISSGEDDVAEIFVIRDFTDFSSAKSLKEADLHNVLAQVQQAMKNLAQMAIKSEERRRP